MGKAANDRYLNFTIAGIIGHSLSPPLYYVPFLFVNKKKFGNLSKDRVLLTLRFRYLLMLILQKGVLPGLAHALPLSGLNSQINLCCLIEPLPLSVLH